MFVRILRTSCIIIFCNKKKIRINTIEALDFNDETDLSRNKMVGFSKNTIGTIHRWINI